MHITILIQRTQKAAALTSSSTLFCRLALDPTALLGASVCKHPASPAMLAGQRRD